MPDAATVDAAVEALFELSDARNVSITLPQPPYFPDLTEQLEAALVTPPDIVTFHFGIPDSEILNQLKQLGITPVTTKTTPVQQACAFFTDCFPPRQVSFHLRYSILAVTW